MAAVAPTCKVVRAQETPKGGKGARIYPKGCKVRGRVSATGGVDKYDKQGNLKMKVKEGGRSHTVPVLLNNRAVNMVYDTGAMVTTMTREKANELRVGGGMPEQGQFYKMAAVTGVGGNQQMSVYRNVDLKLGPTGEDISGEVWVGGNHNLLGVPQQKKAKRYKVKFK